MPTPVRNYQLATVSPALLQAGVGGIDLFAGSFSSSNKSSDGDAPRNIAQQTPSGYAFMMAVKSVSPDLADLMQYLQAGLQGQQPQHQLLPGGQGSSPPPAAADRQRPGKGRARIAARWA